MSCLLSKEDEAFIGDFLREYNKLSKAEKRKRAKVKVLVTKVKTEPKHTEPIHRDKVSRPKIQKVEEKLVELTPEQEKEYVDAMI